MKKDKINTIFAMLIMIFILFVCSIFKIVELKNENKILKESTIETNIEDKIELVSCYLCNGTVKIQPVNESFYIECENCALRTDFFKSKSDLIKYWNKE